MHCDIQSVRLEVLSPSPAFDLVSENASRLDTLDGKTIWEGSPLPGWRGNDTFPVIRDMLRSRFPKTIIIPYTEFPKMHLSPLRTKPEDAVSLERIGEVMKERGCDGVILGNGG